MYDILCFLFFLLDSLLLFFSLKVHFTECIHRHRASEKLRKFSKSCFRGASVPRPFTVHTSWVLSDAIKGRLVAAIFKMGGLKFRAWDPTRVTGVEPVRVRTPAPSGFVCSSPWRTSRDARLWCVSGMLACGHGGHRLRPNTPFQTRTLPKVRSGSNTAY